MKIPQKTITVTLSDPEGNAVFTFERLRENERERILGALEDAKKAGADGDSTWRAWMNYKHVILGKCIGVTGISHGDDKPVTVEDVRSGNLYTDVVEAILQGYQAAISSKGEADSKNETTPSEPPSGSDTAS